MESKLKVETFITKTVTEKYTLSENLLYIRTIVNDKDISNRLEYKGGNINGWPVQPMYKPDLSLLKIWNPFWGENKELGLNKDYSWFKFEVPETPEDIDLKDIVYIQNASHTFFDINFEPIPVVIHGDYIEASLDNERYHLKELKQHLDKHPNIVKCSEILGIPGYNSSENRNQYLGVLVYPEKEWLIDLYSNGGRMSNIFNRDYLKINQFLKKD